MASLEGALGGVAFSSGLAAQLCAVLALAQSGDHLVSSQNIYGGTVTQFTVTLRRMGIEVTRSHRSTTSTGCGRDPPEHETALRGNHRQSVGCGCELKTLATHRPRGGHPARCRQYVRFAYLCCPIEYGADIVLHSATKFIGGHGTTIGGVLVESGTFPWGNGRFPLLSEPSPGYHQKVFTETFGEYAFLTRVRAEVLRDVGAQMSPMDAWLMLLGLETLGVRMEAHVRNTAEIVAFLRARDGGIVG